MKVLKLTQINDVTTYHGPWDASLQKRLGFSVNDVASLDSGKVLIKGKFEMKLVEQGEEK